MVVPLAVLAGRLVRRPQVPILARVLLAYFAGELQTLIACGALWLLSGCGWAIHRPRFAAWHWRLLESFVHDVASTATEALGIAIERHDSDAAERALLDDEPLLVLSRHAGPGDTLLLIDELLTRHHRHPSVVVKEALVLDPSVDVIAHRLPHAVVSREDRERCADRTLHTRMWLVAPVEIPSGSQARIDWLGDWWEMIDTWIEQQRLERVATSS